MLWRLASAFPYQKGKALGSIPVLFPQARSSWAPPSGARQFAQQLMVNPSVLPSMSEKHRCLTIRTMYRTRLVDKTKKKLVPSRRGKFFLILYRILMIGFSPCSLRNSEISSIRTINHFIEICWVIGNMNLISPDREKLFDHLDKNRRHFSNHVKEKW